MNSTSKIVYIFTILWLTSCQHFARDPGSPVESRSTSNPKSILKNSELNLQSIKEKEQYSKVIAYLNLQEKIEFLSLQGIENRQEWINSKQIWSRRESVENQFKDLLVHQDIAMGMPTDLVKRSWGEPQNIEISGKSYYQNEKWIYSRFVPSDGGFKKETRIVYFENGQVAGWETF